MAFLLKVRNKKQNRWEVVTGALGVEKLNDLSDVVISGTPADNEVVAWDTATARFINQTLAEIGAQPLDAMLTALAALDSGQTGYIVNAASDTPLIVALKNNATAPPTVDDDVDLGYLPISIWVDVTNDKAYICLDNTDGAAVWTEITQSGGGGTVQGSVTIQNPSVGDAFQIYYSGDTAITVSEVSGETDTAATTATLNIEERAYGSRYSAGTDVLTSDLVADFGGQLSTTFSNDGIAIDAYMVVTVSAVSATPPGSVTVNFQAA